MRDAGFKRDSGDWRQVLPILALWLAAGVCTIVNANGTGDNGDSITHFLYARYAPGHPELFFDHWAKPFFVLLASPFAQWGFGGMKVFNLLFSAGTLCFVYLCARDLGFARPWMAPLILACLPKFFVLTFSGLTEPLFACMSTLAIWLLTGKRFVPASLLLSLLPFVRSEGLIVAGVAAVYLIQQRRGLVALFLLAGSAAYSLAGWPVHGDLLWVFTKIPYATTEEVYGSGPLFHFVEQLYYTTGLPAYMLFWTGVLWMGVDAARKRTKAPFIVLVAGSFFVFFIAHSVFWYLGIFASMGLPRVLYCILPQAALIALHGLNGLAGLLHPKAGRSPIAGIACYLVIFPFTNNPAAVRPGRDLCKSAELRNADSALACARNRLHRAPVVYDHQYISMALETDHFDPGSRVPVSRENLGRMVSGQALVWDNSPSRNRSEADTNDIHLAGLEEVCRYGGGGGAAVFIVYCKP